MIVCTFLMLILSRCVLVNPGRALNAIYTLTMSALSPLLPFPVLLLSILLLLLRLLDHLPHHSSNHNQHLPPRLARQCTLRLGLHRLGQRTKLQLTHPPNMPYCQPLPNPLESTIGDVFDLVCPACFIEFAFRRFR